jgi:mannose/cellobiose epimerase-like protein (N-acyl-D-glucosamine 2-epimerase family)
VNATPESALQRLQVFVRDRALPLWARTGFDDDANCFHERLNFSGEPVRDVPRRLMVQARQIVVYSRAYIANWSNQKALVLRAFETACQRYRAQDGEPGWIFSVDSEGRPKDSTRDLYTHAFVVYMIAWLYRLTSDPSLLSLADTTLSDIDRIFARGDGRGFVSRVPGPSNVREQNPHMHLFEALLALFDVSGMERYLIRAESLFALFDQALADPATGTVREVFDEGWTPNLPAGENLVEPGHQMEWAWLLREWQRLSGTSVDERVTRLTTHATTYGIDRERGLVRSLVQENGKAVSNASRVWPQTEMIRAICREDARGKVWPNLVADVTEGLFRAHLPSNLDGGWIDQLDQNGTSAVDFMPASTLYHIVGATIDGAASLQE